MEIFQSTILGAVQGLTELLPISSSAHLWSIPYLFGWDHQGLAFDTALHLGTAIAIVAFFWSDWIHIFKSAFGGKNETPYPRNLLWQILIATIPAAIVGFLIESSIEPFFQKAWIVALTMSFFGIILWLVDRNVRVGIKTKQITFLQSFTVGISQCLALIPGVSRSGITMITSRSLGFDRESAARFSFLIGTPASIGAFLFEARKLTLDDIDLAFLLGIVSAAFFGFVAIKFLLDYLKHGSFAIFAVYRLIFAAILLSVYLLR